MLSIGDELLSPFLHGATIQVINSFTDRLWFRDSFAVIPDVDAVLNRVVSQFQLISSLPWRLKYIPLMNSAF